MTMMITHAPIDGLFYMAGMKWLSIFVRWWIEESIDLIDFMCWQKDADQAKSELAEDSNGALKMLVSWCSGNHAQDNIKIQN